MKRAVFIIVIVISFFSCIRNHGKIERRIENGIEVIINHIKPYKIKGEPSNFEIEQELVIDQERSDLVKSGMRSMGEFEVDSAGNIYIIGYKNIDNFIFKIDKNGKLVTSFGRKGQGPGELNLPRRPTIIGGKIAVTDYPKKLVFFDRDGKFLKEISFKFSISEIEPLENGNYLIHLWKAENQTPEYAKESLSLFNSEFKEIKEMDTYKLFYQDKRLTPFFMWGVTKDSIYVANEERGYEIWVFDHEGNLKRKIKKEYIPVPASDEIKQLIVGPNYKEILKIKNSYIPRLMPPLNFFFTDNEGHLFVMTYEKGKNPGEYIYDIFNPDGVFIGRKSLCIPWAGNYFGPKKEIAKYGNLFCYREKSSGFNELVAYKMRWE